MASSRGAFDSQARTNRLGETGTEAPLCLSILGDGDGVPYPLPSSGDVSVGRLDDNDVVLRDSSISRHHARIVVRGNSFGVEDLGSANGVVVRARRLVLGDVAPVAPGEVMQFGSVMAVIHPAIMGSARGAATAAAATSATLDDTVIADPGMRRVFDLVRRVASGSISVLLLGETGVGKDVVAAAVHRLSARNARPFVQLNCAALSDSLLESELFGHERGAFTGAAVAKPGLLESADGGTVFLDEVGELGERLQVKLLRTLEERRVLRVGSLRPREIDVRFVSATNRDLRSEAERGTFRRDLFFRLNGVSVEIPPLRERRSEIEPFARFFAARAWAARDTTVRLPVFEPGFLRALMAYDWPGNVRELRNAVERALLLCGHGPVTVAHLPPEIGAPDLAAATRSREPSPPATPPTLPPTPAAGLREQIDAFERQQLIDALARCAGNQTRAASLLGISRRVLVTKLAFHDIPRPRGPRSGG